MRRLNWQEILVDPCNVTASKMEQGETERTFQAAVVELAKLCRWSVYHAFDSRRSSPGFPDLVLAKSGRVIFAELKSERGTLSKAQRSWLEATGGSCWRPSDWPHIEATLTG